MESGLLSAPVSRLHGDAALWIGPDVETAAALSRRMVRLPMFMDVCQPPGEGQADSIAQPDADPTAEKPGSLTALSGVYSDLHELPFQSRSLDGVVLQHALEEAADPRVMLREVSRVLAPGGRLILTAFNPWSALGLRRAYATMFRDPLAGRRMISPIRLFDWLKLLGLELEAAPAYVGYGLTLKPVEGAPQPLPSRLPFCGLVTISAVKQARSFKLRWQPPQQQQLAPVAYPRVASWREQQARLERSRRR
ncbi:MAG: methyltransferase domain-containing protein [Pseudomonadota bacterium]